MTDNRWRPFAPECLGAIILNGTPDLWRNVPPLHAPCSLFLRMASATAPLRVHPVNRRLTKLPDFVDKSTPARRWTAWCEGVAVRDLARSCSNDVRHFFQAGYGSEAGHASAWSPAPVAIIAPINEFAGHAMRFFRQWASTAARFPTNSVTSNAFRHFTESCFACVPSMPPQRPEPAFRDRLANHKAATSPGGYKYTSVHQQ